MVTKLTSVPCWGAQRQRPRREQPGATQSLAAGQRARSAGSASQPTRTSSRTALLPRLRSSRSKPPFVDFQQRNKLRQFPYVVCQARHHRWGYSQRLVDAGEVVVQEVNRQREPVILNRLAEAVCQPGKLRTFLFIVTSPVIGSGLLSNFMPNT